MANRLQIFRPDIVNRKFFHGIDPQLINNGHCFIWAYIGFKLFENVEIFDIYTHAFVKKSNLYFDSESIHGVRNFTDLPVIKAGLKIEPKEYEYYCKNKTKHDEKSFKFAWRNACLKVNTTWSKLDYCIHGFTKNYKVSYQPFSPPSK